MNPSNSWFLLLAFVFLPDHGTLDSVCLIQNEIWSLTSGHTECDEWGDTVGLCKV